MTHALRVLPVALSLVLSIAAVRAGAGEGGAPAGTPASAPASPTFTHDIAPLVFNKCTSCHRAGEIGPFPMTTYAEVRRKGKMIVEVTGSHRMPPWKAEPGYGDFMDARRLDATQIDLLKRWVEDGMPEGEAGDLPAMPKFPEGWQLGTPDLILTMPEAYPLPAEGRDIYRCFVLPTTLPADTFVKAVEFHPGDPSIVHHAIFYLDTSGQARKLDAADPGLGYTHFGGPGFVPSGGLGGWAPGARPRALPEGVARPLRQGADVVMQIHYHLSGKAVSDRSTIGLYLTSERPKRYMVPFTVGSHAIDISPGDRDFVIRQHAELPADATLIGLTPHAHLLAREMKADAILPDGTIQHLIWIKDWDFNWQEQYRYTTPIHLPAHTRIEMEYHYDNSSDNARNPNIPPKRVTFGEQTTDEMALLFVNIIPDHLLDIPKFLKAMAGQRGNVSVNPTPAP